MPSTGLNETALKGTGIGLMVWTTFIVGARAALRNERSARIQWDEAWLLVAYLFFMVVSGVYVGNTSLMFRILAVQEARLNPYQGLAEDAFSVQKIFFFTSPGLWLTLWSVKFSLLAFYRKMMINISLYLKLWWAVVVYCITLILSVFLHITACPTTKAWFTAGACGNTPRDIHRSLLSFWEGFAVDLSSDLLIMLLPLGLIRNLQIPLARKLQIGMLFGLGIVVMISSIIRVVQVGATTASSNVQPSLTWLALWSIIESSIAIMVGCGPGLYRKAKAVYSSQDAHYYNSRGYFKTSESGPKRQSQLDRIRNVEGGLPMGTFRDNNISHTNSGDSEEELVSSDTEGKIRVTTSVRVSKAVEDGSFTDEQLSGLTSIDSTRPKRH